MIVVRKLLILLLMLPGYIVRAQNGMEDTAALRWLVTGLDQYFAGQVSMARLTTGRYARFKTDAMNIGFDGGMDRDAFEKKWGHSYNTKQLSLYQAFLIPLQDWNKVKVVCNLLSSGRGEVWIAADFTEEPGREHFQRHIKVIRVNGVHRIDDVLEAAPFPGNEQADDIISNAKR